MLENGHSNLQTNLWVHITSDIFKISNSKNKGIEPTPPDLPTLKAYPTPGVGGRFGIFSLKWRERMNLKVPGAILPLGCAILSTRVKTVRGVGTTPLRRTRVKDGYGFGGSSDTPLSNSNLSTPRDFDLYHFICILIMDCAKLCMCKKLYFDKFYFFQ